MHLADVLALIRDSQTISIDNYAVWNCSYAGHDATVELGASRIEGNHVAMRRLSYGAHATREQTNEQVTQRVRRASDHETVRSIPKLLSKPFDIGRIATSTYSDGLRCYVADYASPTNEGHAILGLAQI
ncbi:hypothetical protein ASG57_34440 [Bradyrhizobium sp. Leaf396]|nr:hypothetical protein ASG57_34440 [Bradyrhizobium sp. Leaf396]